MTAVSYLADCFLPELAIKGVKNEGGKGDKRGTKEEHLKRMRQPDSYSPLWSVAIIGTLEWGLG